MKLLRTIRLDPSDRLVFERAAEPGEWAVAGGFMFADGDPAALEGKARMAFRSGILGIESFGWSTLATVAEIDDAERDAVLETLAQRFVEQLGAPDLAAARAAAAEEIAYAAELAQHPVNTLVAVERQAGPDGVVERFRTLHQRAGTTSPYGKAFGFVSAAGDDGDAEPSERVNLIGLSGGRAER
jgi:hypothetical protein